MGIKVCMTYCNKCLCLLGRRVPLRPRVQERGEVDRGDRQKACSTGTVLLICSPQWGITKSDLQLGKTAIRVLIDSPRAAFLRIKYGQLE